MYNICVVHCTLIFVYACALKIFKYKICCDMFVLDKNIVIFH